MGEEISKEIAVDGVDVRELYGAQNVYLEQIRALHPALKIVARGSSLKVLGAKSAAERFERRMQGLIDYYLKYGHISREVVAQAFAASGLAADEAPADQDVIVYGNNGTVVRARTVNQQRLVRLYDADDLLWRDGAGKWFKGRRIDNPNTHGTGCTLSSAIASNLAKGYDLDTSVESAKAYISGALAAMLDLGHGSGPMNHMFALKGDFVE